MRTCSLFAAALLCGAVAVRAGGQVPGPRQGTITGRVTDQSTGLPIPAAAVVVTGSSIGAVTNDSGVYTIRVIAAGAHQLRASRVGYGPAVRTVSVVAGAIASVDFIISHVPFVLEEVVTTATGEQRTRELGNIVAKPDVAKIVENAPITDMQDLLNGRVSGVNLIQQNGTVGSGSRVRIRGLSSASLSNDPLVYVDGIKVETSSPRLDGTVYVGGGRPSFLNDIDPDEIESMEIVKGPSAATLYGTQAANGVIRITTKRAKPGRTQWMFYDEEGYNKDVTDYPGQYYSQGTDKVTGAVRQCLPWQQVQGQCAITQLYSRNLLLDANTSPLASGYRAERGIQINGGTEQVRFFISGATNHEDGTLRMPQMEQAYLRQERGVSTLPGEQLNPNELQRVNLRSNLSAILSNNVDVTLSSGFVNSDNRLPQTGDNTQGILGAALFGSANPAKASNPWGFARPAEGFADVIYRRNSRFTNSLQSNWRPWSFLAARATVGLDYLGYQDEANNASGEGCTICGLNRQGLRTINKFTSAKTTADFGATATRQLTRRIESKTSVGAQWIRDRLDGTLNTANVFPPGITRIDAGAIKTSGENTVESKTLGQYVEQQFGLDQRLYLTGAIRYDQNSAFGKNNRSATYPKISASWVAIENGGGWRAMRWLDELRLRSAYGVSGQQPGPTDALQYLSPITTSVLGADRPAVTLAGLGNDALKPERSQEFESGFDAGFFHSRANLQLTYYNKRTSDALIQRVLPGSLGATVSRIENIGVVTNKGLEASLNGRVVDKNNVALDLNIEASQNANKLVDLGGLPPITGFGYQNRVGYPLFGLWWPQMTSYNDANHNGVIEPSEVVVSDSTLFGGSSVPTRTISFSPTLTLFKRLTFSGLLDRRSGFSNLNANEWFQCVPTQNCRSINDPSASLESQARAIAGGNGIGTYLQDASFWKLRELSMSYSLPERYVARFRATSAVVRLTARNIATWSKFGSWDPEIATQGDDAAVYNFVQLAPPRIWTLRMNLGF
ncbi:MAG: SusC/RagA family TonB-linked outer membrane protein [Gemmatimonadaceae bacterium]